MTEPKKYWLSDGQTHALVTAEERDRWVPLGWQETTEPDDGFVLAWHDGIEQPGRPALAYFRLFLEPNGWIIGPPEGSAHPFAEPVKAAPKPSTSKPAAGGNEKE